MLVIKGGRIIDPVGNSDKIADIFINDGKIQAVVQDIYVDGARVLMPEGKRWFQVSLMPMFT